jgi:hypothetical protein
MIYRGKAAKYNLQRSIIENWKCLSCRGNERKLLIPNDGWFKKCPICQKKMIYLKKWRLVESIKNGSVCKICSVKINGGCFKEGCTIRIGKNHSKETKEKIKKSRERFPHHTEETKKKISLAAFQISNDTKIKRSDGLRNSWKNPTHRKNWINALIKTKFIGRRCDIGQLELLNKWNRLGFNFEPNYQIHTDEHLFYIDGYDKEKNVILEYDSKYHNSIGQKQKDLVRQNKIISILNPKKFWRYDSINKKYKNVLKSIC